MVCAIGLRRSFPMSRLLDFRQVPRVLNAPRPRTISNRVAVAKSLLTLIASVAIGRAAPDASHTREIDLPLTLEPFPAVVAYANRQHVPVSGLVSPEPTASAFVGDEITALVELENRTIPKQWLVSIRIVGLTDREKRAKSPAPLLLYTSTGRQIEFGYKPVAVELLTLAPFFENEKVPGRAREKKARAILNAEFLSLGLDGASRTGRRIYDAARKLPGRSLSRFAFSSTPFPAEGIEATKKLAESIGLTREDERAFTSMMPALFAFFRVAQNAPGLSDILDELVDKPSLIWSFFRHGGALEPFFHNTMSGIRVLDSKLWRTGEDPVYRFPVTVALNGKPTLTCALAVTSPYPPLLACGGIVAAAAEPTENDGRRLTIRVLATRRGTQKPTTVKSHV